MKKSLPILLLGLIFTFSAYSQVALDVEIKNDLRLKSTQEKINSATRSATCTDTLQYPLWKATEDPAIAEPFRGLLFSGAPTSTVTGVSQAYEAPFTPVTISGFTFYGLNFNTAGGTATMRGELFAANADMLPMGQPLAVGSVALDTAIGNGTLSAISRQITFNTPATVGTNYVIALVSQDDSIQAIITSSWLDSLGNKEGLGGMLFQGGWLNSENLSIPGQPPFDVDFMIFPHVSYDINTSYSVVGDPTCFVQGDSYQFTNNTINTSPVTANKFYNFQTYLNQAFGTVDSTFFWDWGDGSTEYTFQSNHTFNSGDPSYDVDLFTIMIGYANACIDSAEMTFSSGNAAAAGFTVTNNQATVNSTFNFVDSSPEAESWLWDFGDGNTSTDQNPTHEYTSAGPFTVCLTITNCGTTDSMCTTVDAWPTSINDELLDQNLSVFPNPSTDVFNLDLALDKTEEVSVSVLNIVGQKVFENNLGRISNLNRQINLAGNNKGIYLLQVRVGDRQVVRRITLN